VFRDITNNDLIPLMNDITADPYHNQQPGFTPGIFMDEQSHNVAIQDEDGEVVFWVNFSREVRVRIQFREGVDKNKVRDAFTKNIPLFEDAFRRAGCKAFLFDSTSRALVWFLKRFGFTLSKNEYRKEL